MTQRVQEYKWEYWKLSWEMKDELAKSQAEMKRMQAENEQLRAQVAYSDDAVDFNQGR